jgi:hypothetical protein
MQLAEQKKSEIRVRLEAPVHQEPKSFREASDEFLKWCFASEYRSKRTPPGVSRLLSQHYVSFFDYRDMVSTTGTAIRENRDCVPTHLPTTFGCASGVFG